MLKMIDWKIPTQTHINILLKVFRIRRCSNRICFRMAKGDRRTEAFAL